MDKQVKKRKKKLVIALKLINEIEKVRSKNNKNWMDLLKLSISLDFKKTANILNRIVKDDKVVSRIASKIKNLE
tara:strand:+ start:1498 stop:1719 length:222 start_codon:yes stop_codon:yes gene_type:complete